MQNNVYFLSTLVENWDFPQCLCENDSGIYGGREDEIKKLENITLKKCRSSVLLCAPRGRGKTSLVYKTLREAKNQNGLKIIPIFIDAPQLEAKKNKDEGYIFVLENIISSLNESFGFRNVFVFGDFLRLLRFKKRLVKLNKKNLASKWSKQESKITIRKYTFSWANLFFLAIISLGWVLQKITEFSIPEKLINLSFSIALLFVVGEIFHKFSSNESFIINKSYDNLYNDFKKLFEKKFKKTKFIFIIDELDFFMLRKRQDRSDNVQELEFTNPAKSEIPSLLKAYKNLFQSVNAAFLFIGDQSLYEAIKDSPKGVLSTIFTELLYLAPPKQNDLYNFLNNIVENNSENEEKWELIKYYLMYKGKGDFKETINAVKDYTRENCNIVKFNEYEFLIKEKNIAKVYRLMSQLYDSLCSEKPSKQGYNEELYESLYEIIQPEIWEDGGKTFENYVSHFNNNINKIRDFYIEYLKKIGIITVEQGENFMTIEGVNSVKYVPLTFDRLTPNEQSLKDNYEKIIKYLKELGEGLDKKVEFDKHIVWIEENSNISIFDTLKKVKQQIIEIEKAVTGIKNNLADLRKLKQKEETDPLEEELASLIKNLKNERYNLYKKRICEIARDYEEAKIVDEVPQILSMLTETREKVKNIDHTLFYLKNDFSKQLILLNDGFSEDEKKATEEINNNRLSFSYKIISPDCKIREIKDWLDNYCLKYLTQEWFVISGVPQIKDDKIVLNKIEEGAREDGSKNVNTFIRLRNEIIKGEFEFEVYLTNPGVLNFVIGYVENDDNNIKFIIARCDTREGENMGCGILQKKYENNWEYITKRRKKFPENKYIKIYLSFDSKGVALYEIRGKRKIMLAMKKMFIKEGKFGIFNELNKAEVKIIKNDLLEK